MSTGLSDAYRVGKLMLFVGAGVSANLNLPTWDELIAHIAGELDFDPEIFATYGTHLALAEYYKSRKGGLGELRSWMDREWHRGDVDISTSEIHRLIAVGKFLRIYTTNYDRWLELAHDQFDVPYDKVATVADLASLTESQRQIIKLHGDFDDDATLVLGETSYFERLRFESPLDIKLRSDVLENSVLFLGYSLSDINIRLLFHRLAEMWNQSPLPSVRPRSYIFTNRPNPVAEDVLGKCGIEMIVSEEDDPEVALMEFLRELVA
jgi:hypothetical protein